MEKRNEVVIKGLCSLILGIIMLLIMVMVVLKFATHHQRVQNYIFSNSTEVVREVAVPTTRSIMGEDYLEHEGNQGTDESALDTSMLD